jgi:predicted ATPase
VDELAAREFWVSGYRSLRDIRVPLGAVNIVVGANASGKTNLYRALYLLHAAASGALSRTLAEEGGMPSALWAGSRKNGPVRMTVGVDLQDFAYELSAGIVPPVPQEPPHFSLDPEVKEEHGWATERGHRHELFKRKAAAAFVRDAKGDRITFSTQMWPGESVLSQVSEPERFPVLAELRVRFGGWRFYHQFRVDAEAPIRSPQVGTRTPVLSHDGRDLAAALQTILTIGDGRALQHAVADAFPGSHLEVEFVDGWFRLKMHTPGMQRPLEARELSDGTLRYLCLLAALLSPRPPTLLLLNEPETSLHEDLLEPLAALVADAGTRSQVLVTTHAPKLAEGVKRLARVEPIELVKVNGATVLQSEADE